MLAAARRDLQDFSSTPSLDAQTLLADITGQPRGWLLAHPEFELDDAVEGQFSDAIGRIRDGVALPYVLGWWEFFGRRFQVNPAVLIPRPETELLVERALMLLRQTEGIRRVLDLGTGSGCIAVTLALEAPQVQVVASDVAMSALRQARANARIYGVDQQVNFVQADLLAGFARSFNLICANLPYVPQDTLPALDVARKEPGLALDGGWEGMELINQTLEQLPGVLEAGGAALFEIDSSHGQQIVDSIINTLGEVETKIIRDLAGRDRLAMIRLN